MNFPQNIDASDIVCFKYAPIYSVNTKRSFSIYKNLLSYCRRSFKFENISKIIAIQYSSDIRNINLVLLKFAHIFIFYVLIPTICC